MTKDETLLVFTLVVSSVSVFLFGILLFTLGPALGLPWRDPGTTTVGYPKGSPTTTFFCLSLLDLAGLEDGGGAFSFFGAYEDRRAGRGSVRIPATAVGG